MLLKASGLPFLIFQMGFFEVQMGYIWGTFLTRTGDITGGHYFLRGIENFFEKLEELKLIL